MSQIQRVVTVELTHKNVRDPAGAMVTDKFYCAEGYVALKPVCEALGFSWVDQHKKVQKRVSDGVQGWGYAMKKICAGVAGSNSMCVTLDTLQLFLDDCNPKRAKCAETLQMFALHLCPMFHAAIREDAAPKVEKSNVVRVYRPLTTEDYVRKYAAGFWGPVAAAYIMAKGSLEIGVTQKVKTLSGKVRETTVVETLSDLVDPKALRVLEDIVASGRSVLGIEDMFRAGGLQHLPERVTVPEKESIVLADGYKAKASYGLLLPEKALKVETTPEKVYPAPWAKPVLPAKSKKSKSKSKREERIAV